MEPKELAEQQAQGEWQRRMIDFTKAMTELVYWDRKPLEQALAYNITMQRENSKLFQTKTDALRILRTALPYIQADPAAAQLAEEIQELLLRE